MKDLIKKIIREETYQDVQFEILYNLSDYKKEIDLVVEYLDRYLTPEFEREVDRYVRNKSPFYGVFNRKDGVSIKYKFMLKVDYHWKERIFRKKDPEYEKDPKIMDIDYKHSVDIITSNPDKLAKLINSNVIKDYDVVNIAASDGSRLHVLVKFIPRSNNGREVLLILKNQIRGTDFYGKQGDKRIYLP